MDLSKLIRPADFAILKGVRKPSVHEAMKVRIADAIVMVDGQRWLDRDLALKLWDKNTRRNNVAVIGLPKIDEHQPPPQPPTDRDLRAFIQGLPEDQIPDLNDSRARREHYLAERARLEALRGRGELVPSDQVKAEAFACARAVRDALLGLADRLAPMLAATTDARECHRLLTEEHRVALRGLSDG